MLFHSNIDIYNVTKDLYFKLLIFHSSKKLNTMISTK